MEIQSLNQAFIMPIKASDKAGAFDIFMPQPGTVTDTAQLIGLGFAAAIPDGHVALLLPRSSVGAKYGLELNNTCGVIDSDYRGEWKATMKTKSGLEFSWKAGERVLQFLVIPIPSVTLKLVKTLSQTTRGTGGFGSTGTN